MSGIVTNSKKFKCEECDNEITIPGDLVEGDYFECEFCGIEYEVAEVLDSGEYRVQIVEEEK